MVLYSQIVQAVRVFRLVKGKVFHLQVPKLGTQEHYEVSKCCTNLQFSTSKPIYRHKLGLPN